MINLHNEIFINRNRNNLPRATRKCKCAMNWTILNLIFVGNVSLDDNFISKRFRNVCVVVYQELVNT